MRHENFMENRLKALTFTLFGLVVFIGLTLVTCSAFSVKPRTDFFVRVSTEKLDDSNWVVKSEISEAWSHWQKKTRMDVSEFGVYSSVAQCRGMLSGTGRSIKINVLRHDTSAIISINSGEAVCEASINDAFDIGVEPLPPTHISFDSMEDRVGLTFVFKNSQLVEVTQFGENLK